MDPRGRWSLARAHRSGRNMTKAIVLLGLLLIGGCASSKKASYDPDEPKRVCESTSIGTEAKTVCY
jgi:hypothetical protein